MSLWGTLSSINLKDVASAARSVGESLVTAVTNADDLVGGGEGSNTGGSNNNQHNRNNNPDNHYPSSDSVDHDGWNNDEDDDLDFHHDSHTTTNDHQQYDNNNSTVIPPTSSTSSSSTIPITNIPEENGWSTHIDSEDIPDTSDNHPLHESMLSTSNTIDNNETTSTATNSFTSAFRAASSYAVKQLPINETFGVLSKIQATVVGKDTIIDETPDTSALPTDNNPSSTSNSFFGNSLVNVMGKLKDIATLPTTTNNNDNEIMEDNDPWLMNDNTDLKDISLHSDDHTNNTATATIPTAEDFQKLLQEIQKLRFKLHQTEDILSAEQQRSESFRKHAIEMEERLDRTVGDREAVENEWQDRIVSMQNEWKTREKERINEVANLRERDAVLSGQLAEANRKNDDLEQRINNLQIAIGTEKEKAEDSRRALERMKHETAAALRETPVDSVAMQETLVTAERYKQQANEATMRLKETKDEMDTLRTQLSTLQEQYTTLQNQYTQQQSIPPVSIINTGNEDKLRNELDHAHQRIEELQASLEIAETGVADSGAETVTLRSTVATLQEEIETLHQQLHQFQEDKEKSVEAVQNHERDRVATLLSALDAAQAQLISLETAHDDASNQMINLENDIKQLRANNKELTIEHQQEEHIRETLEHNLQDVTHKYTTLQKQNEEVNYELQQIKQRYDQAQATITSITQGIEGKSTEEIQSLRSTIQSLENTFQSKEHEYKEIIHSLTEQVNVQTKQIATVSDEKIILESKYHDLQHILESKEKEYKTNLDSLMQQTTEQQQNQVIKEAELNTLVTTLRTQLTTANESLQQLQVTNTNNNEQWEKQLQTKIDEHTKQYEQLTVEYQSYKVQQEKIIESLRSENTTLHNEIAQLQNHVVIHKEQSNQSGQEYIKQIEELQSSLQQKSEECTQLQQAIKDTENKLSNQTSEYQQTLTKLTTITTEYQQLQEQLHHQSLSDKESSKALQKLQEELEQANNATLASKTELDETRLSLSAAVDAHKRLQNAFDRLQADFRQSINREQEAEQASERNNARIKELEELVNSLRSNLEQSVLSERDNKEQIQELIQDNGHLKEQIENFNNKITNYSDNTYQLQKELNEANSHIHDLTAKIQSMEDINTSARVAWTDREQMLVTSLSAAEAKVQSLMASLEDNNRLKADLQVKEIDLQTTQSALNNLQIAFEGVQTSKTYVEERERKLEMEKNNYRVRIEELEKELQQIRQGKNNDTNSSTTNNPSSTSNTPENMKLNQAQIRITQLQQTIHELRKALEDTKLRAMDTGTANVDKRLINQLLLAYFRAQRDSGGDITLASIKARDALLITANFLGMSDKEREDIGLSADVLGQTLPDSGVTSAVKSVGGLLAGLWGTSSNIGTPIGKGKGSNTNNTINPDNNDSLGSAFVQFLLAETADDEEFGIGNNNVVSENIVESSPVTATSVPTFQSPITASPARTI